MQYDNVPATEHLIRELRELVRFCEELTDSIHEMHAELVRLHEQLGIEEFRVKEWPVLRPHLARANKPN